jgi:hypothetical protein
MSLKVEHWVDMKPLEIQQASRVMRSAGHGTLDHDQSAEHACLPQNKERDAGQFISSQVSKNTL